MDLEELLLHWSKQDKAVFRSVGSAPSRDSSLSFLRKRGEAVPFFRLLLSQFNDVDGLPSVLMMFDTLGVQIVDFFAKLGQPVTLAAMARLWAKVGPGGACECSALCEDEELLKRLAHLTQEEVASPVDVARAEAEIVAATQGRVGLPSVPERSRAVVLRLHAMAGARGQPAQWQQSAVASVGSWALLLTEKVAATAAMRPEALAQSACVLGFLAAGLLRLDDLQPSGVPNDLWQESLLVQLWRRASLQATGDLDGHAPSAIQISCLDLAEAACCTKDELAENSFAAAGALQVSLTESRARG